MGAGPCKAPFAELFGLSPPFNVCPEGVNLHLCHDNIVFKLSVAGDFGEVGPVIQLSNGLPESVVLGGVPSEHVAKPARHGFVRVSAVVGRVKVHVHDGGCIRGSLDFAIPCHLTVFHEFDPFFWV